MEILMTKEAGLQRTRFFLIRFFYRLKKNEWNVGRTKPKRKRDEMITKPKSNMHRFSFLKMSIFKLKCLPFLTVLNAYWF